MARNFILLSGGPGLYDPRDPEHDASWANYVTPPLQQTRTRQDRRNFQAVDEEIWWFIYRPAYERRWADDSRRADRRRETRRVEGLDCGGRKCRSYIDLLEFRARERSWNLRWINRADEFWRLLTTFSDPISRIRYWGHARNDLWLSLRHNSAHQAIAPNGHEIIRVSDISRTSSLRSRFQVGSPSRRHIFNGCNTHTFASEWSRVFRVYTRGYEGTLRFTTATQTGIRQAAGCILRNYAPGGSAESLGEVTPASDYFDRLEPVLKAPASWSASPEEMLAEILQAAGTPTNSTFFDPEDLYREIVYNDNSLRSFTTAENFTVLGRPGEAPEALPQAGDVLLRVALGEPSLSHMAVIADASLWPHDRHANAPFRLESRQPGFYAPVIDAGAFPNTRSDRFGRRVLDAAGRMPPGQLLLRIKSSNDDRSNLETLASPIEGELVDEENVLQTVSVRRLQEVKDRVVALANEEYERWDRGHRHETNSKYFQVLVKYYTEGVGKSLQEAERIVQRIQDATLKQRPAWSAAFISWIMEKAGATKLSFKNSAGHYAYVAQAKKNRDQPDKPIWAWKISEVKPEVGDLLCNARCSKTQPDRCGANYENIDNGNYWSTHCDIVTEVGSKEIRVIGGNTSDGFGGHKASTVGKKTVRLDAGGKVKLKGDPLNDYFAIVRIMTETNSQTDPTRAPIQSQPVPSVSAPTQKIAAEKARWIQTVLNAAQGERLRIDGDYGSNTRSAVRRFQERYGLSATGMVDQATNTALIQRALEEIRMQSLFPNIGVMDNRTLEEIKRFQSENNLDPDGIVGSRTRRVITVALGSLSAVTRPTKVSPAPLSPPTTDDSKFRRFRLTRYYVKELKDDPSGMPIFDLRGNPLIRISNNSLRSLNIEGTGELPNGQIINYAGKKATQQRRYRVLPRGVWGHGNRGNPLTPFRSLAVDQGSSGGKFPWKDNCTRNGPLIPFGTRIFIKELVGLRLPDGKIHDGWCVAEDTGGRIYGAHFDWFCGPERWAKAVEKPGDIVLATFEGKGIEEIPIDYDYGLQRVPSPQHKRLRPPCK